jgi:hypothetical protein
VRAAPALAWPPVRGENALVRVVVTRIEQDGTMQRRVVDTAQCDDCLQWGRLAARALEFPPPYRPVPGIPVYHVSVGDQVILVAEHDLGGPLLNLVTAVLALGKELLARSAARRGAYLRETRGRTGDDVCCQGSAELVAGSGMGAVPV